MGSFIMRYAKTFLGLMLFFALSQNIFPSVKDGKDSKTKFSSGYFINKVTSGTTTAKVYGIDKTVNIKFTNPTDKTKTISTSAGTFKGDVDGNSGSFYCTDLFHYIQFYTSSEPHTYTDDGSTSDQIIYVLNNYYPFKTYPYTGCASSVQIEAAAVQVAIWHYSDNLDVSTVDNVSVKKRALEIITATENNYASFYAFETLLIVPASQSIAVGTDASFFVSALDASGNPLSGITVTFTASTGTLSSYSVTTGSNGNTPTVTLSKGASLTSTITASANVTVSPGTKYVHTVEADKWQKLVLATPCGSTKNTTAEVTWYYPAGCDLNGFTTFTQGGWGNKNGTPAKIRDAYFSSVFPSGLTIGSTYKLKLSSASKVKDFLPQGGTSGKLTENYTDVSSTNAGVFAGQLVALKINIEFDKAGYIGTNSTNLGDLQIASGTFSGKTVNQFFALAEEAIGGGSLNGYTYSQYNDAATAINENFDNGTTDNGFLTCASVNVKASLGDKVWLDADKDGIQDSGESGVANVTVKLYDCGDNLISTTTTDASGNYLFDELNPGGYYVKFELPTGYVFTTKDAGSDDALDSDADLSSGKTICTTLTAGQNDLSWDAGIYQETCKNTIGDYIWHDSDVDGIQDNNETGIKGVIVELIQNNSTIATTTTDDNGKYEFSNLANGTYSINIASSNYEDGGVLYSSDRVKWYATSKNKGSDDTKDSDANKNESVAVTLNCADNLTVDFGFYKTCISVSKTASVQSAKPGDKITYTFIVENCGDIQLHGGTDVFDKLLNSTSPYKIKHIDILNPAAIDTFKVDYTVKSSDCGELINEVTAEGHPVDGSAYVTDIASATVEVDCGPDCTTEWSINIDADKEVCEYEPVEYTVNGSVSVTPNPSSGYLITSWKIAYPNDGSVDNSTKADTVEISGNKTFEIKVQWPGVRSTDDLVEIQYSVLVLDCNMNALGKEYTGIISWDSTVCVPPPSKEADLKIEKSSSTQNPQCGDNITYTIKVTNLGSGEATAVQVTDILPAGLAYVSGSASQGTYDESTGLWTVGNLAKDAFVTLNITVKADCDQIDSSVFDLGVAKDFNLFVIQDLTQPSSDTEGKVAVGRDANLASYSVGDKLSANSGDVLIVGRDLTYESGRVYNGDVVYGNSTNLPINQTSVDGYIRKDSPINFASAKTYLENLSTTLGAYDTNGTAVYQWTALTLTGTDPYLNVFKVNGSELSSATSIEINAPNGSAVLVNVYGNNIDWNGGLEVYGTTINNVLYNFYESTVLKIDNIEVRGSILAPFADVTFESGVQNGQMIAKSVTGQGQFNNSLFYGNIPANESVTNIATITGSLSTDPDASNNSASTTVVINSSNQSPGGSSGSGSTGSTWQEVGSFAVGEIVYCLAFDSNNNSYSGTMGGKIYKSTDGGLNWTRINSNMNVGWIWSLVFHNNILFAATEAGVYKFNGSTWSLTSLKDIDVRTIVSDGTLLVAGTWGSGVYSSSDNGTTWNQMNEDLTNTAIQALAFDKSGNLFAGTAGSGLFKIFSGESKWYHYDLGNNVIWALGSSNGTLFASTYGGGLYVSNDEGSNWSKSALGQNYIYSFASDNNNNVYASSWTSGVFSTSDQGSSWNSIGMGGFGVSSIISSPSEKELYAGTREGKIYKISFDVTGAEEETIPTEFKLEQNYPNPFNPSTTIEFALPKSGRYSLKIYNILGQEVATLLNREVSAGTHKVNFNAARFASGVYIYRLTGADVNLVKKMMFIK
jgi:choice-of-anchor A domain-containing protein/uncharacterized repeat protein (TIGR01451 family)